MELITKTDCSLVIGKSYLLVIRCMFRATLVSDIHRFADKVSEDKLAKEGKPIIGTTLQGIGPSYASKILRFGLRVGDLRDWNEFVEKYNKFILEAKYYFHAHKFDT